MENLENGTKVRLFPIVADTSLENRALSIFLSVFSVVYEFRKDLLQSLGIGIAKTSKVECFTEVEFKKVPETTHTRPDGLLDVRTGKNGWAALFEAKIGAKNLEKEQIHSYLNIAKLNGIKSLITISNDFTVLPTHHPLISEVRVPKGIDLFHWSWSYITTQAIMTLQSNEIESNEEIFLLGELIRYFEDEKSTLKPFDTMHQDWPGLVTSVKSGANLRKTAPNVENAVSSWHQEVRDMCLKLSQYLESYVTIKLSRAHKNDPKLRMDDDCEKLANMHRLEAKLEIPDAASPMEIIADVGTRTVTCAMTVNAPGDKPRARSRITWILKQIQQADGRDVFIEAYWPKSSKSIQESVSDVRENPDILLNPNKALLPNGFRVKMVVDLAGKFGGRKKFIQEFEEIVPRYYENIGENLRNWTPKAPTIKVEDERGASAEVGREDQQVGDQIT